MNSCINSVAPQFTPTPTNNITPEYSRKPATTTKPAAGGKMGAKKVNTNFFADFDLASDEEKDEPDLAPSSSKGTEEVYVHYLFCTTWSL